MLYLNYEELRRDYLKIQCRYNEILREKENLFLKTQPQTARFGTDSYIKGAKDNSFDSYLIAKEHRCIDARLEEAKALLNDLKELLKIKEQELRNSKDSHDKIYRMKYIDGYKTIKIATALGYDKSSVYRILHIIDENIRNEIKVATK